jgi:GTP pyrophosphokinase
MFLKIPTTSSGLHKLDLTELEKLFEQVFADYPDCDFLKRVYDFAKHAHRTESRKQSADIPYIVHPLRMVIYMFSVFKIKDRNLLSAALLHDTVEDTDVTLEQIRGKFGDKITEYVDAMTRPRPADEDEHPDQKYQSKTNKLMQIMASSLKVRELKLFDLIDNMNDWPEPLSLEIFKDKYPRWLNEAENYYLPLAESVGPKYTQPLKEILAEMKKLGYKAAQSDFKE